MYNNDNSIEKRMSMFSFSPTGSYENAINKRLDIRQFSTYKLYNPRTEGISVVQPVENIYYVQNQYWMDNYTIEYNSFNYPIPPNEP